MHGNRLLCHLWKFVFVCTLTTFCVYKLFVYLTLPCSDSTGKQVLRTLCDDYFNKAATGDLCHELCVSRQLYYTTCIQTFKKKSGKQVYLANYRGALVVIKSKYPQISRAPFPFTRKGRLEGTQTDLDRFVETVQELVSSKLGYEQSSSSTEKLFNTLGIGDTMQSIRTSHDIKYKQASMHSLWSLLSQDEYLVLRYLRSSGFVPEVSGSCGSFYVVEYVGPAAVLHPQQIYGEEKLSKVEHTEEWNYRANTALKMMDLVRRMKTEFDEELQHCDIKSPNFGMTVNHTIKIIDVDNLFFENHLQKRLASKQKVCKDHDSCGIYTCKGWCDANTKKCVEKRNNNNFQVVCELIFKDHTWNTFKGLLRSPPASIGPRVTQLLDDCSSPVSPKGVFNRSNLAELDTRFAASQDTFDQLYEILSGSLD